MHFPYLMDSDKKVPVAKTFFVSIFIMIIMPVGFLFGLYPYFKGRSISLSTRRFIFCIKECISLSYTGFKVFVSFMEIRRRWERERGSFRKEMITHTSFVCFPIISKCRVNCCRQPLLVMLKKKKKTTPRKLLRCKAEC